MDDLDVDQIDLLACGALGLHMFSVDRRLMQLVAIGGRYNACGSEIHTTLEVTEYQ